jgi:uncharacterized protein YjbJ (UPF0337 family)
MNLFLQARKILLNVSLVLLVSTSIALGSPSRDSWAATSLTNLIGQSHIQIATIGRAEAFSKDIEGKAQEAVGNITGDPKDQVIGKAKQAESKVRQSGEDLKSSIRSSAGRPKAISKNIEGKAQEGFGNATDDLKNKAAGKAKQAESQVRNTFEDVKANIKNIFD